VRIFIASGDRSFRLALLLLLESEPGLVVTGMIDRREDLLTVVQASHPEAVVLDDELATATTTQLVINLRDLDFQPKVIVLSSNPETAAAARAAGADGFISKTAPPDELLPVLHRMRLTDPLADALG
jgi:two-component system, NarL family, invasion response regulator UvrY